MLSVSFDITSRKKIWQMQTDANLSLNKSQSRTSANVIISKWLHFLLYGASILYLQNFPWKRKNLLMFYNSAWFANNVYMYLIPIYIWYICKWAQSINWVLSDRMYLEYLPMSIEYRTLPWVNSMRPKARGLAQHGGPPIWLEEIDPSGSDFVFDRRSMPPTLTDPRLGLIYYENTVMSYVTQGRHGLVL